jgi:D-alanine-D-alanine ligase
MRILVVMHEDLVPPVPAAKNGRLEPSYKTEAQVMAALQRLGHEVIPLGVHDSVGEIRSALHAVKPHVVFNLLEEFAGQAEFDAHVVSYFEMQGIAFTGCNAKGLQLARDKAITKVWLKHHGIRTPAFIVLRRGAKCPSRLPMRFPLIVKALNEEASIGLGRNSVVYTASELSAQVVRMHEDIGVDVILEEFIAGREFYVGLLGNTRPQPLPLWELNFGDLPENWPRIAGERLKWSETFQKKYLIKTAAAGELTPAAQLAIRQLCLKAYSVLGLTGYARMDLRMADDGTVYFLEANPNPNIAEDEDFALSAAAAGMSYTRLLQKMLRLGLGGRNRLMRRSPKVMA